MEFLWDFHEVSLEFLRWFYDIPIYWIPVGFPWYFYDTSMGLLWDFQRDADGISMGFLWVSKGCLWDFYDILWDFQDMCRFDFFDISMGFLWDSYGISMVVLWNFSGSSKGCLWDFHWISDFYGGSMMFL